jgi:hypothetical protein
MRRRTTWTVCPQQPKSPKGAYGTGTLVNQRPISERARDAVSTATVANAQPRSAPDEGGTYGR